MPGIRPRPHNGREFRLFHAGAAKRRANNAFMTSITREKNDRGPQRDIAEGVRPPTRPAAKNTKPNRPFVIPAPIGSTWEKLKWAAGDVFNSPRARFRGGRSPETFALRPVHSPKGQTFISRGTALQLKENVVPPFHITPNALKCACICVGVIGIPFMMTMPPVVGPPRSIEYPDRADHSPMVAVLTAARRGHSAPSISAPPLSPTQLLSPPRLQGVPYEGPLNTHQGAVRVGLIAHEVSCQHPL